MTGVTATRLTEPLSEAADVRPLASVLRVLGTKSRLETVQLLLDGPRLTAELPARIDELHMLEDVGVITSERIHTGTQAWRWRLRPEALVRVADCLRG